MIAKTKKAKIEGIDPSEVVVTLSPGGKRVLIDLLENSIQAIELNKMHDAASLGILAHHLGRFAMHADITVEEPIIKFDQAANGDWFDDCLSESIQGRHQAFWEAIGHCRGAIATTSGTKSKVGAS